MRNPILGGVFLVKTYPVFNKHGDMTRMVCIAMDMTEKRRMEEQIRKSLKEKEALLKEVHHRVGDNGVGVREDLDFRNTESLGLHLVNTLTQQLHGEIDLKRGKGTEFSIRFRVTTNV